MQSKIEQFKGFYFDDSIEDGSIVKVVLEKKKVCVKLNFWEGVVINFSQH